MSFCVVGCFAGHSRTRYYVAAVLEGAIFQALAASACRTLNGLQFLGFELKAGLCEAKPFGPLVLGCEVQGIPKLEAFPVLKFCSMRFLW